MSVCILRGRAGLIVILYVSFHLFEKKIIFRSSYTISSIIVACETRLTENGIPPERNLRMASLIPGTLDQSFTFTPIFFVLPLNHSKARLVVPQSCCCILVILRP